MNRFAFALGRWVGGWVIGFVWFCLVGFVVLSVRVGSAGRVVWVVVVVVVVVGGSTVVRRTRARAPTTTHTGPRRPNTTKTTTTTTTAQPDGTASQNKQTN